MRNVTNEPDIVMLEIAQQEALPVSQAKAGEAAAWEVLLSRFRLPIYIYVYQLVGNEQASFDIVQETMLSAIRNIGSLQDNGRFAGWLYGIAHQKCVQLWRRQNREEDALREFAQEGAEFEEDPRQALIRAEQKDRFLKLLEELPVNQRAVLVLYFIEDFSLEEIASITGASLGTVKSRLHYAKKAFRNLWEKQS